MYSLNGRIWFPRGKHSQHGQMSWWSWAIGMMYSSPSHANNSIYLTQQMSTFLPKLGDTERNTDKNQSLIYTCNWILLNKYERCKFFLMQRIKTRILGLKNLFKNLFSAIHTSCAGLFNLKWIWHHWSSTSLLSTFIYSWWIWC